MLHEADALHRLRDLTVLHEPVPDVAGAHVRGAQQDYADVDPDHIGIDPTGLRIECVDKAVLAINLCAVLLVHRSQRATRQLGREHQRATRC